MKPQLLNRQRCILVADDEPQNISLIMNRLTTAGLQVIAAPSGRATLEAARKVRPDLILLDMIMPDMGGLEILSALQEAEETAHIPVIFVSADTDPTLRITALGRGGHDYVTRPFHPEELLARVGAALRIKETHDLLRRQHEELTQMVRRDSLTGLYNRRHLDQALSWELSQSHSTLSPLSLVLLDLDHFKQVNDTFGHATGDAVLTELATLLSSRIRQNDILGRYGGEEFLIILPHTPEYGAVRVANSVRRIVEEHTFESCPSRRITFSAGVASVHGLEGAPVTPAALLALADQHLYAAKRQGRNLVVHTSGSFRPARTVPAHKDIQ